MVSLSPLRSLAEGASPQPDRLGHLLSQACFRRWLESPPSRMSPLLGEPHPQVRPAEPRLRETQRLGPLHADPREGIRDPPHPRCLPSIGPPPKECARAHLAPSIRRSEITTSWRLFFHRRTLHLDEAENNDDSRPVKAAYPKVYKLTKAPQRPYRLLRSERPAARDRKSVV